ncbi:MAG: D-mannonate dehydratase [Mucilaginibacter sp.]|nr:D-mannonate dehydratase [Mucilaginibacter sp.]
MTENRRDFIRKTGISLAAVSVTGISAAVAAEAGDADPKKNVSGDGLQELANSSKIRIAVQAPSEASAIQLNFYKQAGVNHVILLPDAGKAGADYYKERKKYFAETGLDIYGINDLSLINDEKIVLNLPGRDARIELYKQHLRNLGKAGITYTTYAHSGNGVWSSGNGVSRADAVARTFNPNGKSEGQWGDKKYAGPLSHGRQYTTLETWANFEHFIKAVAPVAEENNIKIGILPDDPLIPKLGGVPRLFTSLEGYQHALAIAKSPNVGVCLGVGTWAQGGNKPGKDVFGMIDYFGKQRRLFGVVASNIDQPGNFTETFVDNGYIDMYKVMKALKKVNFDGVVVADHMPKMLAFSRAAENDASLAWTIGYTKCLRDRVEEEAVI